jgi:hypothetical protein
VGETAAGDLRHVALERCSHEGQCQLAWCNTFAGALLLARKPFRRNLEEVLAQPRNARIDVRNGCQLTVGIRAAVSSAQVGRHTVELNTRPCRRDVAQPHVIVREKPGGFPETFVLLATARASVTFCGEAVVAPENSIVSSM